MATMKSHLGKTIPEKMFRWENGANNYFFGKNGAIAWEGREMREKWGNCVTLTLNAWQLAGLSGSIQNEAIITMLWKYNNNALC